MGMGCGIRDVLPSTDDGCCGRGILEASLENVNILNTTYAFLKASGRRRIHIWSCAICRPLVSRYISGFLETNSVFLPSVDNHSWRNRWSLKYIVIPVLRLTPGRQGD